MDTPEFMRNTTMHGRRAAAEDWATPLKLLCVDDCETDVQLIVDTLRHGEFAPDFERVCTREAMDAALERQAWDAIICDYSMPQFDGIAALAVVTGRKLDLPFVLGSGAVRQETSQSAIQSGVH